MTKFRVAIAGGGIAGLCLGAALIKQGDVDVDVYESSPEISEVGAGLTLWGRVCEALHLMELAEDCINASVVVASTSGLPASTGFKLRGFGQPDKDFGRLPMKDAWSLHRADLIQILARRVPPQNVRLGKQLIRYRQNVLNVCQPIFLEFSDGTTATCDVLVGCDGLRSAVRAQMMQQHTATSGSSNYLRYIEPRWSGTIAYRVLIRSELLAARNPRHPMLTSPQIYLGKSKHVVGYPISTKLLNVAVNTTDRANENGRWPSTSSSRVLDREAFRREIAPQFENWDPEVEDILECIESAIEWPVMDLEPLPFYAQGRVTLIGDSAHAAVPYVGAGAAFAIEDAYVLSRILNAPETTRATLPSALEIFQAIRRPYGNKLVSDARLALREFQYDGPHGDDMQAIAATISRVFYESARAGGSGPEADGDRGVSMMEGQ